jgi:hypothetical protein
MLLYLSNNSRRDIAYAVHHCARFSHNPKESHAQAVKTIVCYLKRTRNKGLVLNPSGNLAVNFTLTRTLPDSENPKTIKILSASSHVPDSSSASATVP